jgi:hypothetical protein
MRSAAFAVVLALVRAACALGGEAAEELPPVPREAQDAYGKGEIQIERTLEKKKKGEAVTADDWDVALGFFTEAQQKAPTSPTILKWLAIAHEGRGAFVAAKAWLNAYLAAFPRAKDRLAIVQHTRELELQAQVVIRKVFAEALSAAELVPHHGLGTVWSPDRGSAGMAWSTPIHRVHCRTEVMFLQADAGDVEGAASTAKTLADGIRQGSWDQPAVEGRNASDEWHRRFSVWKAGHDAMAATGDWAGAMALYVEHHRAGLLDQEGAASLFRDVFDFRFYPRGLRDEIRSKIDKGRDQPLGLSDWLALANEVSKASDEPGLELRLKQIRGGALKPAEMVMAVARTAVPIGQALLRVRALENRTSSQDFRDFGSAIYGKNEDAKRLIRERPRLALAPGTVCLTAKWGDDKLDVLELLFANGGDPNARSGDRDQTALHYAAQRRQPGAVRLLLAKGANPNAVDNGGITPLHEAAIFAGQDNPEVVKLLLDAGANVNARLRFRLGDGTADETALEHLTRPDGNGKSRPQVVELLRKAAQGAKPQAPAREQP